jgi:hypothetical protein
MRPPTADEMADMTIPHVHLTSDMLWDPTKYDSVAPDVDDTMLAYPSVSNDATAEYDCDRFMAELVHFVDYNQTDVLTDMESLMQDEFYEHGEDCDNAANGGFSVPSTGRRLRNCVPTSLGRLRNGLKRR